MHCCGPGIPTGAWTKDSTIDSGWKPTQRAGRGLEQVPEPLHGVLVVRRALAHRPGERPPDLLVEKMLHNRRTTLLQLRPFRLARSPRETIKKET